MGNAIRISTIWFPVLVFMIAFVTIPLVQLDFLRLMPGDIGDARLNNYFLEHIYQFLFGNAQSLWNLSFFYPLPYVLGFSDNHFGTFPSYFVAKLTTNDPYLSYQLWFLFGYSVNFSAAYYAFRRMNGTVVAATIGALIFTFALPTSAHAGHAQLHYRFGVPLALTFLADFYVLKSWRYLIIAMGWLVWQFYSGIYMGFFTLLAMLGMSFVFFALKLISSRNSVRDKLSHFMSNWQIQSLKEKLFLLLIVLALLIMLLLLFFPYIQVLRLYGATRSWDEISSMLPRPQSYFLADYSILWSTANPWLDRIAHIFVGLPARHEHQMFMGLAPIGLAIMGLILGSTRQYGEIFSLMSGTLFFLILTTLYIGGFSVWYFVHGMPLASAIRAVSRIDQVLLFPIGYLSVVAVDELGRRRAWCTKHIAIAFVPIAIFEFAMTKMGTSTKISWIDRTEAVNSIVPKGLDKDSILFFAQRAGPPFADELDAMWVAIARGMKTMNGYSGLYPPGYSYEYGQDCAEIGRRSLAYLKFEGRERDIDLYRHVVSLIFPVGFRDCNMSKFSELPGSISD